MRERARAAWQAVGYRQGDDGPLSENGWWVKLIMDAVRQLEREHNDARP